jgi:hypothetical protein
VPLTVWEAEEAFHRSKRKIADDYDELLARGEVRYHGFYADLGTEWGAKLVLRARIDGLEAWWGYRPLAGDFVDFVEFGSVSLGAAP